MTPKSMLLRAVSKYRRTAAERFYCRNITIKISTPIISFSFDDAPKTAFQFGGEILKNYGGLATYYVSLGMLGTGSPSGTIASQKDLVNAVEEGHELGCHTFDHKDSWDTPTEAFIRSVIRNRMELARILPSTKFQSFAYPICLPRPGTKRQVGRLFACCRGGGQTFNAGVVDSRLLNACFLDSIKNFDVDTVKRLIDQTVEIPGWLIFATHDVSEKPSPFGCSKNYLEEVVSYAAASSASLLPVGQAFKKLLENTEKVTNKK